MKRPPRDSLPGTRPKAPAPARTVQEPAAPDSVTRTFHQDGSPGTVDDASAALAEIEKLAAAGAMTHKMSASEAANLKLAVSPSSGGPDSPNQTIVLPTRPPGPSVGIGNAFGAPVPMAAPPPIAPPQAGLPPSGWVPPASPPSVTPPPHAPRSADGPDTALGRRGAGPGSFSRIFLGSVEKYRARTGNVGSASQEAAAVLAQQAGPAEHRLRGPTLKLRSPLALVETLVLTLLLPALGWLVDRNDPFFLNHRFSWIVAAPLLLGLRHGFAPALASAVVLDSLIAVSWRAELVPMEKLPGEAMIGVAALAMITGQFSDVWKRELVRLDGGFDVLRKQLGEVMRAHFLLELSHDRLEERIGKGTPNLRDALVAVQRAAAARPGATLLELGDAVVEIFAQYTNVEVGALYRVEDDRIELEPVAKIGRPAPFDPNDEQVQEALQTRKLTFIRSGAGLDAGSTRTKLLAVVPFVDGHGTLRGLLTIESIPLLAFDRRNLETLALLGGRFADAVAMRGDELTAQKGQRKELEVRLRRAIRDLVENDVPSTMFVLLVRRGGAASDSIEAVLGGSLRALDFPYIEQDAVGNYIIYILLPLTDEAGARAFSARIERIVQREGNMPVARAGAFSFHHVLRPDDTVQHVMHRLESKAKLDEGSVEHTIVV